MTAVSVMTRYHKLGWALKRLMGAENVQARSQEEFADKLSAGGYPIGQQLISDYMRERAVKVEGERVLRPRAYAPMEFVAAVIVTFDLDDSQMEDLVGSWLEVLPEKRRIAVLALADTLQRVGIPANAWRDMLMFERDREEQGAETPAGATKESDGGPARDRAS